MEYKVCILAAGTGTSIHELAHSINKAVLPINFKAVISHIVEKFPKEVPIVVAVGHKKETIIDYLALAHPDRTFTFVEIDNYVGPGTGPGFSLLKCKEHLQSPFILYTADTIVLEDIPVPDTNWMGIAPVKNTEPYCTVQIQNNQISALEDKTKNNNKFAFIGLAGIHDYEIFFQALGDDATTLNGEIEVSNGFKGLIASRVLSPIGFTWFDTGTIENYRRTNKRFSGENKFDFSKGKGDEFLYFIEGKVIKFFANEQIASDRCERAEKYLNNLCPNIESRRGGFYVYQKVDGRVLYDVLNRKTVADFLQWALTHLWQKIELSTDDTQRFQKACKQFYQEKTNKRLEAFYAKTGIKDAPISINGVLVPALKTLFEQVDWDLITAGVPTKFHGDLQFDNILATNNSAHPKENFVLLDWRQDFAGLLSHGDLYYDLAKLYGGTLISYKLIKEAMFSFDMNENNVCYNYYLKNDLVEAREEFEHFLDSNGFDTNKVRLITALIFLNMSPLHEEPFDKMLYFMGRSMLHKICIK